MCYHGNGAFLKGATVVIFNFNRFNDNLGDMFVKQSKKKKNERENVKNGRKRAINESRKILRKDRGKKSRQK